MPPHNHKREFRVSEAILTKDSRTAIIFELPPALSGDKPFNTSLALFWQSCLSCHHARRRNGAALNHKNVDNATQTTALSSAVADVVSHERHLMTCDSRQCDDSIWRRLALLC